MKYALTAIFLTSSGALLAQPQPQLTWSGYVSGSATLYIQGNNVDAQGRTTGAVDRPTQRFHARLPAREQTVEVDVVRGNGRVLVAEQPSAGNEYSAVIRVDPRGNAHEYFVLNFFWDTNNSLSSSRRDPYSARRGSGTVRDDRWATSNGLGEESLTWSGRVDHEALIEIRGRRANVRTVRGQRAATDSADFTAALPRQDLPVQLADAQGRGQVELVQEPSAQNNYVAVVRILDTEAGADNYSFRLLWEGTRGRNRTGTRSRSQDRGLAANDSYRGVLTPGGSGSLGGTATGYGENRMVWTGRVDGTVQLVFRDDRVTVNRISGSRVTEDQLEVGAPLPNGRMQNLDVRKLEGRGDVRVISQPSAYNNYALTVEIADSSAGADFYGIEVSWQR